MKVQFDCYPCFVRQALLALRLCLKNKAAIESFLKALLPFIAEIDTTRTPAHTTTVMHRRIRQLLGIDPFDQIKHEYNQKALAMFEYLTQITLQSPDPLWTSARLAIAGNIIDFSIFTTVDMESSIRRALTESLAVDNFLTFKEAVKEAVKIIYLVDNAGEIVFDRVLIDVLQAMGKHVSVAVKGQVVINDATKADALEAGLDSGYTLIDNGSDGIGTILELCSESFCRHFDEADLIISKGQGNFETLHELNRKSIFFLFQTKCLAVSRELGLSEGAMLLSKSI
jgi:uncharacterized protein with ATP-grasp and redox domains